MSRRDLCQPSFVDAMVRAAMGRLAGFWTGSTRRSTGRRLRLYWPQFTLRSEAHPAIRRL